MTHETRLYAALVITFVATYATVLYLQAGPLPVGIICGSMIGGMIAWLKTTAKRPADPAVVLPAYLLTLFFFTLHVLEEYLFDFEGRISSTFGVRWSESEFVLLIVLIGPAVWIAGAALLWARNPLGNFIVWFMFVGMILGEPTHMLIFPLVEGGRYHYFPGMWTALFPMVPAIYGAWRIVRDHRRLAPAGVPGRTEGAAP